MDPRLAAILKPLLEQDEAFQKKNAKLTEEVQERRKRKVIGNLASQVVAAALDWDEDPSHKNRAALRKAVALLRAAI